MWEGYYSTNQWYKEDTKGSSSKDSSVVFVESTKRSPTINKAEEPVEAKDSDPKMEDDRNYKTSKMVLENQRKILEMVLGSTTKDRSSGMTEEDKLAQDDQRIKVVELDKLGDSTDENSSIACGDWIHRIKPVISNLFKRLTQYWKIVERVVEERYQKYLVSSPIDRLDADQM